MKCKNCGGLIKCGANEKSLIPLLINSSNKSISFGLCAMCYKKRNYKHSSKTKQLIKEWLEGKADWVKAIQEIIEQEQAKKHSEK